MGVFGFRKEFGNVEEYFADKRKIPLKYGVKTDLGIVSFNFKIVSFTFYFSKFY